jgi:hypothetical protein
VTAQKICESRALQAWCLLPSVCFLCALQQGDGDFKTN